MEIGWSWLDSAVQKAGTVVGLEDRDSLSAHQSNKNAWALSENVSAGEIPRLRKYSRSVMLTVLDEDAVENRTRWAMEKEDTIPDEAIHVLSCRQSQMNRV